MTLQLILTADSSQRLHRVRCLVEDRESICRWSSRSKAFLLGPWAGQQHLQALPDGEDIYLAGWLGTRMTRPHVICSITIYDPVILNHKKKSHLRPRPGYILLCLLCTQPLQHSRSTQTTCPSPPTAGIREDGRLTHLASKDFCNILGWLPAASVGYRCEVISRL